MVCLFVYIHLSIYPPIRLLDSAFRCPAAISSHSCVVAEEYEVLALAVSLGKYKLTVNCITVSKPRIRR